MFVGTQVQFPENLVKTIESGATKKLIFLKIKVKVMVKVKIKFGVKFKIGVKVIVTLLGTKKKILKIL